MASAHIIMLITIAIYLAGMVAIGIYCSKDNETVGDFYLGGRKMGPIVTAMSAEAADMSSWLLMGLPGVAYIAGIAEPAWTAIGLAVGTYVNWLIVSKRLRNYSYVAGNAITLPDFFSNRYKENKKVILGIASLFILVFFAVYASSCFVTCGKLFATLFGLDYKLMMIIGAVFVIVYTILGGFLAESASDFMQAIVMISALVIIVVMATVKAGGPAAVLENAKAIPGFFEFFGLCLKLTICEF